MVVEEAGFSLKSFKNCKVAEFDIKHLKEAFKNG